MTKHNSQAPLLNLTAIVGLSTVLAAFCAAVALWFQCILPEINSRQKISDDVDTLKIGFASMASEVKEHTGQNAEIHRDILDIKRALHIKTDYQNSFSSPVPANVTAVPSQSLTWYDLPSE